MKKKLIIFDLDDTIFSHDYSHKKILGKLLNKKYGIKTDKSISAFEDTKKSMDKIKKFDSIDKYYKQFNKQFLKKLGLDNGEKNLKELYKIIEKMKIIVKETPEIYPNVKKVLKSLKEKKYYLAILTGSWNQQKIKNVSKEIAKEKIQRVNEVLTNANIKQFFNKVFVAYSDNIFKPNERAFKKVLNYFKVSPEEAIMIGNEEEDMLASKIGITVILFDPEDKYTESIIPEFKFKNYLELENIINSL